MQIRALTLLSAVALVACGDDDSSSSDTGGPPDTADTSSPPDTADTSEPDTTPAEVDEVDEIDEPLPANQIFAFSAVPGQSFSDGPFPSDALLGARGTVELAPLGEDPRFAGLAHEEILARTDGQVAARTGFGILSSVFFPMNAEPDLASFEGAVRYVALSGPEEGKVFPGIAGWFAHADYLAVSPAWGQYLVPDARYAVIIDLGVKSADGRTIEAPPAFEGLIAAARPAPGEPDPAFEAFAALREWLSTRDESLVIATVFTTEETLPYLDALYQATDAFELEPPSANMYLDEAGNWQTASPVGPDDLDAYFGVAAAPWAHTPGVWYDSTRRNAALLEGGSAYEGGTFRGDIAWVVNGTFLAPAFNLSVDAAGTVSQSPITYPGGAPSPSARALVPFSVFLCASHLTDGAPDPAKTVPVAVFTHGGSAIRGDAVSFAVANCAAGYATVSFDLPYHGGRQALAYSAADDVVAPAHPDEVNVYSGRKLGEADFVPDFIGDEADQTISAGGLLGLPKKIDPDVIESNLITIATDVRMLVRYLREPGPNGLGAFVGTTFDGGRLVMESLSFGTSFTTSVMAGSDDFVAAVEGVGAAGMVTPTLTMSPNTGVLAGGVLRSIYGMKSSLAEVNNAAPLDPVLMMLQWLSQKGDAAAYAPFVLRHRRDDHALHVYGQGNSWDERLFGLAQMTFQNAWGVPVFTAGPEWTVDATMPGSDAMEASAYGEPLSNNLTYGGRTQTAGYFYNRAACHAQVVTPICSSAYQPPYPPAVKRDEPIVSESPICALQAPLIPFLRDIADGRVPTLTAPGGTCEDLYSP